MRQRVIYILFSLLILYTAFAQAAGPPVKFDRAQFQDQVLNMLTEELSGKIDDKFHEAVDKAEVDLLKMSNFYYLLDDFKELGIDPANPQISQSLNGLYEKIKERYDTGETISKDEIKGYLADNWKTVAAKVMDQESADIIEGVYSLSTDAWNKVKALEEITQAEESMSEAEIMDVFKKWGVSGKFLDKLGDLEIVLRDGYNYIAEPLEAANDVIAALSEKNPGKKIGLMFALGSKYSGKIPIIGDIVKQIFVLGEAVLKAANEMGGLLSRNYNQGCISDVGQYNLQNDDRASSFLQQFPTVKKACPLVFDPDGKKKVSAIYKHTYYDMDNGNHLYFYINNKWLKGKELYHKGDRDLRAIIGWLRSNGMADKIDDEYLLFQLYNHSPGFIEYRERLEKATTELSKKLFTTGSATEHTGVLSILGNCDDPALKDYITAKIPIMELEKLFPISYRNPGWDQFRSRYSFVWEELEEHTMHCQYNRYLKNKDYQPWSSGWPIDLITNVSGNVNFTPVKIWGVVKNGGQLIEGAAIDFERSGSLFPGEDCKQLVTNERGNFLFYYIKSSLSKESLRVEATDTEGKSNSEREEIDLGKGISFYYTIDLKQEGDCPDGQEWNTSAGACEVVCPANSSPINNSDGLAIDCKCDDGYKWNAGETECLEIEEDTTSTTTTDTTSAMPDCSIYPNMVVQFNTSTNKYYCDCEQGFVPDPNNAGCIKKQLVDDVDCSMFPNTEARINPATGGVVCDCKSGYVWKDDMSGCITIMEDALNRADCSAWPNTKPRWSAADNAVICDCIAGYEWDDDYTICEPNKQTQINAADCSQWPNTRPVWDDAEDGVICDCIGGYEWNDDYTLCVPDQSSQVRNADCSAYPNTGPRWDDVENGVVCDCIYGYDWNSDYSGCEKVRPEAPDCSDYYANTRPVWDKKEGKYFCECIKGYEWNQGRTGCEPTEFTAQSQGSSACKQYGPATGKWNSARGGYDCYCKSGYVWNATNTYCVPDPNRQQAIDNIIDAGMTILQGLQGGTDPWSGGGGGTADNPSVSPENQHPGVCNTVYRSGANAPESYSIPIQQGFGSNYKFYYDHISVKDRTHVYYGGQKIFDTGCVGGSNTVELNLSGYGGNVTVIVDPNCEGTSNTAWSIKLICP